MFLNGIVLVSAILNFQTAEFDAGNDQPYELFLPTYCATAFYHKKLAPELQRDLQATLAECEAFAQGEYALALRKGSALPDGERAAIATKLARFTGLSKEYVERTNLRVEISRFCKELERERAQDGRPARQSLRGRRPRRRGRDARGRPEHERDPGAVHSGAQPLPARGARLRERPRLRDPHRPRAALEVRQRRESLPRRGRARCAGR